MRTTLNDLVGRGHRRQDMSIVTHRSAEIKESRDRLKQSWTRVQECPPGDGYRQLRQEHRRLRQREKRKERLWNAELVTVMAKDISDAAENNDYGRFYKSLRELGIFLMEGTAERVNYFTPAQAAQHFKNISGEPINISAQVLEDASPYFDQIQERLAASGELQMLQSRLEEPPDDDELLQEMHRMRVSAGGGDEITILLLKGAGPRLQYQLGRLVRLMWTTPPDQWSSLIGHEIVQAVTILLWKKK